MNNYNNRGAGERGGFKGGDRDTYRGADRGASRGVPDFKKRSFGSDRGSNRDITMHKATCADCKKTCEVPFRPNGEKPVFCRDCFGAKRGNDDRGGSSSYESKAPAHIWTDRNPSVPSYAKPDSKPQVSEEMKRQISDILYKLDKLTHLVEKLSEEKVIVSEIAEEETEEVTPKKKVVAKKKVIKKAE
jgi:CxxC-x17-CxxC domain-containing protein